MASEVVDLQKARQERPFHSTVAANVRAECARLGVSQKDIAAALGKTQQVVSSKMRGQTPFQLNELAVIAPMLHMTVLELIAGVREPRHSGPGAASEWAPWGSNPQPTDCTSEHVTGAEVVVGPWTGSGIVANEVVA